MKSAAKILLLFFMLALLVSGLSIYWTFFKIIPSPENNFNLQGLTGEVTIRWEDNLVPHITAGNEADAFLVTGYLHARDRLWQMTRYQYKLEGLHSREIDESLIDLDTFFLTMPFAENARDAYSKLPYRDQQLLQAYASGINQFIENNRRHLPIEFTLSDATPVKWEPWHALGVQLLWGWQHHNSFWSKLALTPIHEWMDASVTHALTGLDISHTVLFGDSIPEIDPILSEKLVQRFLKFTDNVYPERTMQPGTGFAQSTKSPQPLSVILTTRELPLTLPDQGYEMAVKIGDNKRFGITIPGFPFMIFGQNENVAWAIQPVAVDDGDFFTGRLFKTPMPAPVDWKRNASVYDNLFDDISLTRHILEMKNGAEYQIVTRDAGGRPVVSISESDNAFLAFDWAGFNPPDDFSAYLALSQSRSLTDIEIAVQGIQAPAIQVIAIDGNGNSGRWYGGHTHNRTHPLKVREVGEDVVRTNVSSLLPSQTKSDGQPVFFQEAQPDNLTSGHYLSLYFSPWDRSLRFRNLMETTSQEDLQSDIVNIWDTDTYSYFAASLTPDIITELQNEFESTQITNASDTLIAIALPYLQNWNFEYRSNETAATIFELFLEKAATNLYKAYIGDMYMRMLFTTPQIPLAAVTRLIRFPNLWPDTHPFARNEWIRKSMIDATSELIRMYGNEPYDWQWGMVMQSRFESPFYQPTLVYSKSARLADENLFFPGTLRISGSSHTIHSGQQSFLQPFTLTSATTLKRIMFLDPEQKAYSILSTGQSGNIFSDHFDDQFHLWKYGNKMTRLFHISSDSIIQRIHPANP